MEADLRGGALRCAEFRVSPMLSDQLHGAWVHKIVQDFFTTSQRRRKTALRTPQGGPKTLFKTVPRRPKTAPRPPKIA